MFGIKIPRIPFQEQLTDDFSFTWNISGMILFWSRDWIECSSVIPTQWRDSGVLEDERRRFSNVGRRSHGGT